MAIIRRNSDINIIEAARKRIINTFSNHIPVAMSVSGGKDSVVMMHLVYELIREGKINPDLLEVDFVDEEAVLPCIEDVLLDWKSKFEDIGVKFNWFCLPIRLRTTYNTLFETEHIITWDPKAEDVWIRKPPKFAIRSHPSNSPGLELFQGFLAQKNAFKISMIGIRAQESLHRLKNIGATMKHSGGGIGKNLHSYPIYDFTTDDVWLYIKEHDLDFANFYIYMWEVNVQRRSMRIAQPFAIDSGPTFQYLMEIYPDFMERCVKRVPNIYLSAVYGDTDMFRRRSHESKRLKKGTEYEFEKDCREKCLKLIAEIMESDKDADKYTGWKSKSKHTVKYKTAKSVRNFILGRSKLLTEEDWCQLLAVVRTADPMNRVLRSFGQEIAQRLKDAEMWEGKK